MNERVGVDVEATGERSEPAQSRGVPGQASPPSTGGSTDQSYVQKVLAVLVLLSLAVGCFVVLRPFIAAILWATILTFATWPAFVRLERLVNGRRGLAALLMTLIAGTLLLVPIVLLSFSLAENVMRVTEEIRAMLASGLPPLPARAADLPVVGQQLSAFWERVGHDAAALNAAIQPYLGPIREWLLARGSDILEGIVQLSVSLLAAFFLYRDGPTVVRTLDAIGARIAGPRAGRLIRTAGGTINSVVRGVLGTSVIQAILMAVGLGLAGVPGALLLGFISFFLSLIPMALLIIWLPATIWLASQDAEISAAMIAIWGIVVGQIDNFLRPYLIHKGSDLPILLIFLGVLGGALAFGFIGIFLGPTLLAVGHNLIQEWSAPETAAMDETLRPTEQIAGDVDRLA